VINSGSTVIGSYQVTIHFDPNLLSLSSVTGGTGTGYTGTPFVVNTTVVGQVTINSFQTDPSAPTGNFTVAHLVFTPMAAGTVTLTTSGVTVTDHSSNSVSPTFLSLSAATITIN
jgi:hypothetical protein